MSKVFELPDGTAVCLDKVTNVTRIIKPEKGMAYFLICMADQSKPKVQQAEDGEDGLAALKDIRAAIVRQMKEHT